ncbi:hypothetical protein [Aulosira sp. FACHB-615]|uniref:hypothetical protein n=1 Tax=Aulosira sp. FACHB-615 TaxID=2692777 RepID=UPI0016881EC8|nr:hypothetical protein [Aulosira sp. FACHB-615]MBD2492098.1 hypothetical protein [Aulosira sp. FACHB-615]
MEQNKVYAQERERILNIAPEQYVKRSLAEELIKKSAYWYSHRSQHPVHAPNHFKHIHDPMGKAYALINALRTEGEEISTPTRSDWKINFGGNTFLISKAVLRCQSTLLTFLDNAEVGEILKLDELKHKLKMDVRKSVANYSGQEYEGYYSSFDGNHLIFGSQSISTEDFANVILSKVNVHRLFKSNQSSSSVTTILAAPSLSKSSNKKTLRPQSSVVLPSQTTCPYCSVKVKTTNLQSHTTGKCPKKPSL